MLYCLFTKSHPKLQSLAQDINKASNVCTVLPIGKILRKVKTQCVLICFIIVDSSTEDTAPQYRPSTHAIYISKLSLKRYLILNTKRLQEEDTTENILGESHLFDFVCSTLTPKCSLIDWLMVLSICLKYSQNILKTRGPILVTMFGTTKA